MIQVDLDLMWLLSFLGEFELLDVPSSKTEKKLHKIKLPLLKQSKPSSRAKSHPAVNKKGM